MRVRMFIHALCACAFLCAGMHVVCTSALCDRIGALLGSACTILPGHWICFKVLWPSMGQPNGHAFVSLCNKAVMTGRSTLRASWL